ncbi:hypothetical protein ACOME3_010560, partial [Neoechinorhynchus agilis]
MINAHVSPGSLEHLFDEYDLEANVPMFVFYNTELNNKSSEQLLEIMEQGGKLEWIDSMAFDHDKEANTWLVSPIEHLEKAEKEWIHRIRIYFSVEDPMKFVQRFCFAVEHKKIAEDSMRIHNSLRTVELNREDLECIDRITKVCMQQLTKKDADNNSEVVHSMMRYTLVNLARLIAQDIKTPNIVTNLYQPIKCKQQSDSFNVKNQVLYLSHNTLFNKIAFHKIKEAVVEACITLESNIKIINFFDDEHALPLEEMRDRSKINSEEAKNYIMNVWRPALLDRLLYTFSRSRYFITSINVADMESFRRSEMPIVLQTTRQIIQ